MRCIIFFAKEFSWNAAGEADANSEEYRGDSMENAVVSFVHVEPSDPNPENNIVPRFLKQIKQIARKWETTNIVLYTFSHLGEDKADPAVAKSVVKKIRKRLSSVGFSVKCTPFRCFVDFRMDSPGAPLSRAFRQL